MEDPFFSKQHSSYLRSIIHARGQVSRHLSVRRSELFACLTLVFHVDEWQCGLICHSIGNAVKDGTYACISKYKIILNEVIGTFTYLPHALLQMRIIHRKNIIRYLYYVMFMYCFIALYPAMECSFYVESYRLCRQRMSVKLGFPEKYEIAFHGGL